MTNTYILILEPNNHRNEVFVMSKIISLIIQFLNRINKIIWKIIIFLSKFIKIEDVNNQNDKPSNERYRQFKVDEQPIIEPFVKLEHKDHKQLIKDNNITPVKRRNGKSITIDVTCPCCGAPKDYLYDNNGKQTQFECKVCSHVFSINPNKDKDIIFKCPHCTHTLDHRISRNDFDVYVCKNPKCSYYLNNLASLTLSDKKLYKEHPEKLKLHYVYRKFNIDLQRITQDYHDFIKTPIDISRAYKSHYIIGLCLTYHVI